MNTQFLDERTKEWLEEIKKETRIILKVVMKIKKMIRQQKDIKLIDREVKKLRKMIYGQGGEKNDKRRSN